MQILTLGVLYYTSTLNYTGIYCSIKCNILKAFDLF